MRTYRAILNGGMFTFTSDQPSANDSVETIGEAYKLAKSGQVIEGVFCFVHATEHATAFAVLDPAHVLAVVAVR